ncbi:MAG: mechanosensitive ion channel [Verrucomicrobiae bacterium]|nr:mechanosensitive ion channel [Verrucomicrobiae bacterium]
MKSSLALIDWLTLETAFQRFLSRANDKGPELITGLIVFLFFWAGSVLFDTVMRRVIRRAETEKRMIFNLIRQSVKTLILILGVVTALGTMGVDVSALVAGLGLTGFALGFALRDALSNVLGGVMILIYRPFRLGDRINVAGFEGEVADIDLRYTTLASEEKKFLVPNSILFTNSITVFGRKS